MNARHDDQDAVTEALREARAYIVDLADKDEVPEGWTIIQQIDAALASRDAVGRDGDAAVVAKSAMTGWSGWATQYPGRMPRLFGERCIAEMNWYPHEGDGHALIRLVEVERIYAAMSAPPAQEPAA